MNAPLVLSLFPGIGLLDMAFEEVGFTVVRGPDLLWGGDVHKFHPPSGKFDGVIGGPPCQVHSTASVIRGTDAVDLIPEFSRCVVEARPGWFLMENVPLAPVPQVNGYAVHSVAIKDHWVGGETGRQRRFTFGTEDGRRLNIETLALHTTQPSKSVMATTWKRGKSASNYVGRKGFLPSDLPVAEYGRLQGAPNITAQLDKLRAGKAFILGVIGNGVPLPMGRAVAKAVWRAMYEESERRAV